MENTVLNFINRFKCLHQKQIEESFLYGNCWYFSVILSSRFVSSVIMYEPIENHFLILIDDNLYDIRGNVTELYNIDKLIVWNEYELIDKLHYDRIVRDCIQF